MGEFTCTSYQPGEDNQNAVLTNAYVKAARELRADFQMSVRDLARMYGCSTGAMSLALRGITFKTAGGPIAAPDHRGNRRRRATLEA